MCIFREKLSIKLLCATLKKRLISRKVEKVTGWSQFPVGSHAKQKRVLRNFNHKGRNIPV